MTLARASLAKFLAHGKSTLANAIAKGEKVTLVIGNESADLDSLTSALLLAYVRSNARPTDAQPRLYIPILNIPAADIKLRPEFSAVLRHAKVEPESLITLDDLPSRTEASSDLPPENTRWILVDHNALQGSLGSMYGRQVRGAIDHHDDEHTVPGDTGKEPRIIEKCGSCTSLVANYCRDAWNKMAEQPVASEQKGSEDSAREVDEIETLPKLWDAEVAKLALASVLIDTNNLQSEDKVTQHDIDAVEYLEAKINASARGSEGYNRDQFFEMISDAKQDIGQLELHDILRKDYKQWNAGSQTLGIGSVVKPIDFLADKALQESDGDQKTVALVEAINKFASDRKLGMFSIMTTSTSASGEFQRELLLSAMNTPCVQAASAFEKQSSAELDLAKWHGSVQDLDCSDEECWRRVWQQGNIRYSRKQIAPLLRRAMGG